MKSYTILANGGKICLPLIIFTAILFPTNSAFSQTLIAYGSSWKYLDNGSNQGTAWRGTGFSDASWATGNAELGYGDGDETTTVSFGPNAGAKFITTYFRKTITGTPGASSTFTLNVKRDDGIVVYVNGTERYRNNLPTGTISSTTLATNASDDGEGTQTATLPAGTLVSGTNVIAVEIHQTSATSSDLSFDLELIMVASGTATLQRGPYLQRGTPSSVTINWRSSAATDSKVSYGTSAGSLSSSKTVSGTRTDHSVTITGLSNNTKYFYSIGSTTQTLQGNADNYFVTAPPAGSTSKTRIWVTGDCGNNSTNQANVRNAYQNYIGTNTTNVWLLLGDNAYNNGTDAEYQTGFFNIYKDKMLKQAVVWPSPGNHDYANNGTRQNDHNIPYYTNFVLPAAAEAGGVASGTEAFYSFNYANIHFLSLDSYGKENNATRLYDTTGAQVTWIKQDLAANTQKWTIVYFHHTPYTMGSHNSDTETELVRIRTNLLRILERYKVDLVLTGHSHVYERTRLMKGHFGLEPTFDASTHNLSSSSAKYDGSASSCPYIKNGSSATGTVYVTSGSAGALGGQEASWPHNAMYYSNATNGGSMAIEIEDNRLDAKWICADGVIRDQFTAFKDVNKTTNVSISPGQSTTLTASWVGNYAWSPGGATSRSVTVSPGSSTTYTVSDNNSCVSDVFNVTVDAARKAPEVPEEEIITEAGLKVFPNPLNQTSLISYTVPVKSAVTISIYDINGRNITKLYSGIRNKGNYSLQLNARSAGLSHGLYFVKFNCGEKEVIQRIIINR